MAACSSQEKFNVTSFDAMAFVITTIQAFAGLWINGFIVCVLCAAWVKKKIFNSSEKILLFLGCFRFLYACIAWVYSFLTLIYAQCFYVHPIPQVFAATISFLNSSNTWASACLCVFYCIKIANFQHIFFIYLKAKIDRIVPWLLFGSVLLALIMGMLDYDMTEREVFESVNYTTPGNLWNMIVDEHNIAMFLGFGFLLTTAFTAANFSALLLLFSLWRHKRRMEANSMRNLRMDAHIKAIKSILSFIFIYCINFTGFFLAMIYSGMKEILPMLLVSIFQYALPVAHSLILIFSNPILEKAFLRAFTMDKSYDKS